MVESCGRLLQWRKEDTQWQKKTRAMSNPFSSRFFFLLYCNDNDCCCLSVILLFLSLFSTLTILASLVMCACEHTEIEAFFLTKLSCSMTKEHTHIYCVPIIHAYSIEDLCRWPLEHKQMNALKWPDMSIYQWGQKT
jgi:hypothetical protein